MAAAQIARRRGWNALVSFNNQIRPISDIAISSSNQVREDSDSALSSSNQVRDISDIVKSNANWRCGIPVDTLRLVRRLEGQGVPTKQAEAMTLAIIEVLHGGLENASQSFVSNGRMQLSEMSRDASFSKFKSEMQSAQEHSFSLLQREIEKLKVDIEKLRSESKVDIEKLRSELRYEIDKLTAGQRLDLNLERGRMRDEFTKQTAETANVNSKLDREIHALKALLEGAKYDIIKYGVGSVFSIAALGLAIYRIIV